LIHNRENIDIQPLPYLDSLDIWDTDTRGTRVLSDLGQKSYGMEFTTGEVATARKSKEKKMHIALLGRCCNAVSVQVLGFGLAG